MICRQLLTLKPNTMITIDLCLTDLPDWACRKSVKNGRTYINLVIAERRETDQFGNTHTVFCSQSKEMRENKEPKTYVGSGKETKFKESSSQAENPEQTLKSPFIS